MHSHTDTHTPCHSLPLSAVSCQSNFRPTASCLSEEGWYSASCLSPSYTALWQKTNERKQRKERRKERTMEKEFTYQPVTPQDVKDDKGSLFSLPTRLCLIHTKTIVLSDSTQDWTAVRSNNQRVQHLGKCAASITHFGIKMPILKTFQPFSSILL